MSSPLSYTSDSRCLRDDDFLGESTIPPELSPCCPAPAHARSLLAGELPAERGEQVMPEESFERIK